MQATMPSLACTVPDLQGSHLVPVVGCLSLPSHVVHGPVSQAILQCLLLSLCPWPLGHLPIHNIPAYYTYVPKDLERDSSFKLLHGYCPQLIPQLLKDISLPSPPTVSDFLYSVAHNVQDAKDSLLHAKINQAAATNHSCQHNPNPQVGSLLLLSTVNH